MYRNFSMAQVVPVFFSIRTFATLDKYITLTISNRSTFLRVYDTAIKSAITTIVYKSVRSKTVRINEK